MEQRTTTVPSRSREGHRTSRGAEANRSGCSPVTLTRPWGAPFEDNRNYLVEAEGGSLWWTGVPGKEVGLGC